MQDENEIMKKENEKIKKNMKVEKETNGRFTRFEYNMQNIYDKLKGKMKCVDKTRLGYTGNDK